MLISYSKFLTAVSEFIILHISGPFLTNGLLKTIEYNTQKAVRFKGTVSRDFRLLFFS
jgi:hypothetical protein